MIEENKIEELLIQNEENIRKIAHKLKIAGGNEDDLVQEGMIGFIDGIRSFDRTRGDLGSEAFTKFALMCAKREMLDAVRHASCQKYSPLNGFVPLGTLVGTVNEPKIQNEPEQIIIDKETQFEKLRNIGLSENELQIINNLLIGYSKQEIACRTNKTKKAIEDICYRIRKKIKGEN